MVQLKAKVTDVIIGDNKDFKIEKLVLGPYETNAYILICKHTKESAIVDAPSGVGTMSDKLRGTIPKYILLTHDHYDHTDGMTTLREKLKVPLAAHQSSSNQIDIPPEIPLRGGEIISLGNLKIEALFTPGHTAGSLCFKTGKYLFAGDTLFPGGPGHTDTPDDFETILKSITAIIYRLPDDTIVLPGHGKSITVGKSRTEYSAFTAASHAGAYGDVTWTS